MLMDTPPERDPTLSVWHELQRSIPVNQVNQVFSSVNQISEKKIVVQKNWIVLGKKRGYNLVKNFVELWMLKLKIVTKLEKELCNE